MGIAAIEKRRQGGDVLFQGFTKVRILMIDGNAGKRTELIEGDGGVGRKQAAVTGDDEGGSDTFGRMGEGPGISELAPKVQTTEEGEDLAESDGFTALQAAGEFEAGTGIEDQLGAFAAGFSRGQQKHLVHKANLRGQTRMSIWPGIPVGCLTTFVIFGNGGKISLHLRVQKGNLCRIDALVFLYRTARMASGG